jgi:hypothetical protein
MKLLSLDFELMGVFDGAFVDSWICEAAGGYPSEPGKGNTATINGPKNPWDHHSDMSKCYDPLKAKLAAQNGLKDNVEITKNRKAIGEWIQGITGSNDNGHNDTVWVGHNFRTHDWHFIKSLETYKQRDVRPAIIDTLELALLLEPDAKDLHLEKEYKKSGNAENSPVDDAEEAYLRACIANNASDKDNCSLLSRIKSHPLKGLLDQILLRDAEHSDWLKKDWQSVIDWFDPASNGKISKQLPQCDGALLKDLLPVLNCQKRKDDRKSCPMCSGSTDDFKRKFCEYLEAEPYACAYFVCWLAKVQGTAKKGCVWENKTGKFTPHPWIVQNHPAVLHLIRLFFANEVREAPATADKERPPQPQEAPATAPEQKPPLEAWLHEFSKNAKDGRWKLKGRYVEIPAACKKEVLSGPTFPRNFADGLGRSMIKTHGRVWRIAFS